MKVMAVDRQLKLARKRAGLTQAQLAEKCGLATVTIQQYERGVRQPSIERLQLIADALNVSAFLLMTGDNEETAIDNLENAIGEIENIHKDTEKLKLNLKEKVEKLCSDYKEPSDNQGNNDILQNQFQSIMEDYLSQLQSRISELTELKSSISVYVQWSSEIGSYLKKIMEELYDNLDFDEQLKLADYAFEIYKSKKKIKNECASSAQCKQRGVDTPVKA